MPRPPSGEPSWRRCRATRTRRRNLQRRSVRQFGHDMLDTAAWAVGFPRLLWMCLLRLLPLRQILRIARSEFPFWGEPSGTTHARPCAADILPNVAMKVCFRHLCGCKRAEDAFSQNAPSAIEICHLCDWTEKRGLPVRSFLGDDHAVMRVAHLGDPPVVSESLPPVSRPAQKPSEMGVDQLNDMRVGVAVSQWPERVSGQSDSNRRRPAWEFACRLATCCGHRTYERFLGRKRGFTVSE